MESKYFEKSTNQQLKEEPGIFVCVLSADAGADDHLQGQLLVKLLQQRKGPKLTKCMNTIIINPAHGPLQHLDINRIHSRLG